MSDFTGLSDLVQQVQEASRSIEQSDSRFADRLNGIEKSVNELFRKVGRPAADSSHFENASFERKSAIEMCRIKHALDVPKIETTEYVPSSAHVDEAIAARRGLRALIRHGDANRLDAFERKSLSAFTLGTKQFLMPPEMSNQVLSCLVDPSDLSGLVNRVQISAGSIKFLIDNARMGLGAWACDSSCFANNPVPDLQAGLGELEIKAVNPICHLCHCRFVGRRFVRRDKLVSPENKRRPPHHDQRSPSHRRRHWPTDGALKQQKRHTCL